MKRVWPFLLLLLIGLRTMADEGLWLSYLLGEQVYADMVKKGLKLTKEQLFSINKISIKDAVVSIGGRYTGAIVSNEGLLFTNHRCGYEALSSGPGAGNNLLDGFYAHSRQEEIMCKDLYADFLLKIEDVSGEMEDSLKGLSGAERMARFQRASIAISKRYGDERGSVLARVSALLKGNQFLVFVYQRYQDLRLVGIPAAAIGTYGAEPDHWQWPRYAGDFSLFRVYMGRDGYPAVYNTGNIPLKSKYFFPISLKGYKEGDNALMTGYPESSDRYVSTMGIREKIESTDPLSIKLLTLRKDLMLEEMKKDPSLQSQLARAYGAVQRQWIFYDAELRGLVKSNLFDSKKKYEDTFQQWAQGEQEYVNMFRDWVKLYAFWKPYAKHRIYIKEGILGSPLIAFAASLQEVEIALVKQKGGDLQKILQTANTARQNFLKAENKASDRKILAAATLMFFKDVDKNQHPIGFYESLKGSFGDLRDENSYSKYAAAVFANTMIFDDAKWNAFISNPDATVLQADPAFSHASHFLINWQSKYEVYYRQFLNGDDEFGRLYLKGILKMEPKKSHYPDANNTMRLGFGSIRSYNPGPSIHYDYICTMTGLMEKYHPENEDSELPPTFLELARKKDFGPYADKQKNDLVLNFITNNDFVAGSAGSPMLNSNGELIGLASDANHEALIYRYGYDPALSRNICVDIRYALWCMEKVGRAGNIVSELKLVK